MWGEREYKKTENYIININGKIFPAANINGAQHGAVSLFLLRKGTGNIILNPLKDDIHVTNIQRFSSCLTEKKCLQHCSSGK